MPFDTLAQQHNWMVRRWQQDHNFYLEVCPIDKYAYARHQDIITRNVRRYYPSSLLVREYGYPEYQLGSGDLLRLVYNLGTVFDQIRDAAVIADLEREIR